MNGHGLTQKSPANGHALDAEQTTESTVTGTRRRAGKETNGYGNGHAVTDSELKPRARAPIDWEIPRKALHGSIGMSLPYPFT